MEEVLEQRQEGLSLRLTEPANNHHPRMAALDNIIFLIIMLVLSNIVSLVLL